MPWLTDVLKNKSGLRRFIGPKRALFILVLFAGSFWVVVQLDGTGINPGFFQGYLYEHPVKATLLFILAYAVSAALAFPTLPLNLAAGYFWGGIIGGIYSAIGVTVGGWCCFKLSRLLLGQLLAMPFENKWADRVRRDFEAHGWKFVAVARLNPIIPTGPLNYFLGLTSLTSMRFLFVTFVFLLPPSIAVSFIGDIFQSFVEEDQGVKTAVRAIYLGSGAITFLLAVKIAARLYSMRLDRE